MAKPASAKRDRGKMMMGVRLCPSDFRKCPFEHNDVVFDYDTVAKFFTVSVLYEKIEQQCEFKSFQTKNKIQGLVIRVLPEK